MFFLVIERVVKVPNMNAGHEQYAPRTINTTRSTVSGPFTRKSHAEKAMLDVMAVHTTLSAQVYDVDTLASVAPRLHLPDTTMNLIRLTKQANEPATV